MSEWLRLLNEMKRRSMEEYLTGTQRSARDQICDLLRFPNRINLYGKYGSGKTYVAWSVVRATGATHVTLPEKLKTLSPKHEILLIDNAPHHEAEIRRLMASANLLEAVSVVFITREAIGMPMSRVQLTLPAPDEISFIVASYARLGFYQRHDLPATPNLWNIMHACV
jgi:hypothetical protein